VRGDVENLLRGAGFVDGGPLDRCRAHCRPAATSQAVSDLLMLAPGSLALTGIRRGCTNLIVTLHSAVAVAIANPLMQADLVIRNGLVLDGSGQPGRRADVAVTGGRITAISEGLPPVACEMDASGQVVTPGFIDIHSHSDYTLLVDPRAESALYQGVTLEVLGNCGHGCFPLRDKTLARRAIYGITDALPLEWDSAAGYFERLEAARPAINVLSLVPNGQLRLATLGLQARPAAASELRQMVRDLEESLDAGAFGYSNGLEYPAESAASRSEIETLCRVVARRGALYATHTRFRDEGSVQAVEDVIDDAGATGVRLQISHLLPRSGSGDCG